MSNRPQTPAIAFHIVVSVRAVISGMIQFGAMQVTYGALLFLISLLVLSGADSDRNGKTGGKVVDGLERLMYITGKSGIAIYDINDSHNLIRKVDVPDTADYKGISASVSLAKLYLTSNLKDELVCLDLATGKIDWRRHYDGGYADSQAITPDGKTLYVPMRDSDSWWAIDAATGDVKAKIKTEHGQVYADHPIGGIGPHNTWMNPDGSRVYMSVLTVPYIFIADTKTNKVIGKAGPFSKGIRPFVVSDDEKYVYANVDWLLGFEVAEGRTPNGWGGRMLHRVEWHTPASRIADLPNVSARKPHSTMSHGINLRPDQKEIWFVDGVYGYVYVFDVTSFPAKHVADLPIFKDASETPKPGWVSFSLDGKYAYPDGGVVYDAYSKKVVARIPTSEKMIEIQFRNGKPVKAGHR
jgi:YVTN family beta-propeller protein